MYYIYFLKDLDNNIQYVGQTKNPNIRKGEHKRNKPPHIFELMEKTEISEEAKQLEKELIKKEEIRKEYFKLKIKGHTNNQCRKIILVQFGYEVNIRTLRRWTQKLNQTEWNLKDNGKKKIKVPKSTDERKDHCTITRKET